MYNVSVTEQVHSSGFLTIDADSVEVKEGALYLYRRISVSFGESTYEIAAIIPNGRWLTVERTTYDLEEDVVKHPISEFGELDNEG